MNGTLFTGSLCLTEIMAKAKAGHSAFTKADNGKIYFNASLWVNSEPDKFGNDAAVKLSSKKEQREKEGNVYIGNFKLYQAKDSAPPTQADLNAIGDDGWIDGLPF